MTCQCSSKGCPGAWISTIADLAPFDGARGTGCRRLAFAGALEGGCLCLSASDLRFAGSLEVRSLPTAPAFVHVVSPIPRSPSFVVILVDWLLVCRTPSSCSDSSIVCCLSSRTPGANNCSSISFLLRLVTVVELDDVAGDSLPLIVALGRCAGSCIVLGATLMRGDSLPGVLVDAMSCDRLHGEVKRGIFALRRSNFVAFPVGWPFLDGLGPEDAGLPRFVGFGV